MSTAFFIALGSIQQAHLGDALRKDWLVVVLAFVVSGLTVLLPGRLPLIASFLVLLAFEFVSTSTEFDGISIFCSVFGGFFLGLMVRSLIYQGKHWNDPRPTSAQT